MEKMKLSAALELAQKEKMAGRSGELEFGGRGNTVKPRAPKRVMLTLRPRGVVEIRDLDGNHVDDSRTGVVMWFAAPETTLDVAAACHRAGLSLGDMVEYDAREVEIDGRKQTVPAGRGHLRDVWAADGQIITRVELEYGQSDAPLLTDLRRVESEEATK